jgi:hypothetical protein
MADEQQQQQPAEIPGQFRTRAQRAEESYADSGSVSVRTDDRFGTPRKGESLHGWQARETAWKGRASDQAQKAGSDATFKANMDRHAEGVARAQEAERQKATAARNALLGEARVLKAKHDAAAADDALLAWYQAQKKAVPGKV